MSQRLPACHVAPQPVFVVDLVVDALFTFDIYFSFIAFTQDESGPRARHCLYHPHDARARLRACGFSASGGEG